MSKKGTAKAPAKKPQEEKPEESLTLCRFRFDDTETAYEIDPFRDLTVEEQIMVEELFDRPWAELMAEGWLLRSVKAWTFFGFLARRRKEPEFTFDQAIELNVKGKLPTAEEAAGGRPTDGSKSDGSQS